MGSAAAILVLEKRDVLNIGLSWVDGPLQAGQFQDLHCWRIVSWLFPKHTEQTSMSLY